MEERARFLGICAPHRLHTAMQWAVYSGRCQVVASVRFT
jgi:hypothetical protein